MRMVGCGLVIAGALGALGIEACLAEALSSPVRTEVSHFDVFVGNRKVGRPRQLSSALRAKIGDSFMLLAWRLISPVSMCRPICCRTTVLCWREGI